MKESLFTTDADYRSALRAIRDFDRTLRQLKSSVRSSDKETALNKKLHDAGKPRLK